MLTALSGCATGAPLGSVLASAYSANYTEDYIRKFSIETGDGKDTGAEGMQVKPFSKGGTGGTECCSYIPGVGQKIRIVWWVDGYNDPESRWSSFSREVVTTGSTPSDPDTFTYLIVRFFPDHQIEAEYIAQHTKFGSPREARADLLLTGQRVMRRMGE
ncbi:DUF3304 domain-containing protein [Paraburkholderia aspalathi]|uniref:DUF3304 domain-containing protein n=1 Tax=Paraburkholderia aspalathi TaxID=1324617 RepID=UPI0038BB6EC7